MAASISMAVMTAACLFAIADWAPLPSHRGVASITAFRRRMHAAFRSGARWLLAHAAFHGAVLAAAFAIGPLSGLREMAAFYFLMSITVLWMAPAGIAWGREIGSPPPSVFIHSVRRRRIRPITEFLYLLAVSGALASLPVILGSWKPHPELSERLPDRTVVGMLALLAYALISAPIVEEILFRQYLLCRLCALFRSFRWPRTLPTIVALAITTALFAALHANMIEPAWIKWTQIGIVGLALGICQLRYGLLAAMAIHFLFNTASVILALTLQLG